VQALRKEFLGEECFEVGREGGREGGIGWSNLLDMSLTNLSIKSIHAHHPSLHPSLAPSPPPSPRNFELHAIFWALYRAHPAIARAGPAAAVVAAAAATETSTAAAAAAAEEEGKSMPPSMEEGGGGGRGGGGGGGGGRGIGCGHSSSSESSSSSNASGAVKAAALVLGGHHQLNYPCNSVSRDVVIYMEARKPVLCNNQKKMFMLRGNLHHDTSLFQGRAWLQIPGGKTWESCK